MQSSMLERGTDAENRAARFLEARGLRLLARNLRCRSGELDLVCLDGETLVIVEVRLRVRTDHGDALASVTRRKQQRIIRATRFHWQRRAGWRSRRLRFDVVGLRSTGDGAWAVEWIRDAFRAT
jgi:putative endonuclease